MKITKEKYTAHSSIGTSNDDYRVVDATVQGTGRDHDDLIWVQVKTDGMWMTPEDAIGLAAAIRTIAENNLRRRNQL